MAENRLSSRKYQLRQRLDPTIAPLTAAIGSALAAGSLQAATITVDTLADGIPPDQCSLRGALYSATSNGSAGGGCSAGESGEDTIVFDSSLSGTIVLGTSGNYYDGSTLPIGGSVIVDGDERIAIQGTGAAPVMYQKYDESGFQAEEVEIRGLTITGGGGDNGGAIRSNGRLLRIEDSTFTGNSAVGGGGAIWHSHQGDGFSELVIFRSEISGNVAGSGGAIAVDAARHNLDVYFTDLENNVAESGGAISWTSPTGSLSLNNQTRFYGNQATTGVGGAVQVVSLAGYGMNLQAREAEFYSNSAALNAGAIAIIDSGSGLNGFGTLRIQGTRFEQNQSGQFGGAIAAYFSNAADLPSGPGTVIFEAGPYSGEPSRFLSNSAESGGGVSLSLGNQRPVLFDDVEFTGNDASNGDGGGGLFSLGDAGLSMSEVTISSNTASGSGVGGGFSIVANDAGDVEGRSLQVSQNVAVYGGGIKVEASGGDVRFDESRFVDNTATASYGGGLQISGTLNQFGVGASVFSGNSAGRGGGGLDLYSPASENALAEVKYSEWSNNSADSNGGAISVSLGPGSQTFIENSTLSGNTTDSVGGAIASGGEHQLTLKYSTLANNSSAIEGGGLFTSQTGDCFVYNTLFDGNTGDSGNQEQDLRTAATACEVRDSLLSGDDSEFTDSGGNVLYQDPLLLPLADNGGPNGLTHALQAGSPAIDAGNSGSNLPSSDQRGDSFQRVFGAGLDIGAYEVQTLTDGIFNDRFQAP